MNSASGATGMCSSAVAALDHDRVADEAVRVPALHTDGAGQVGGVVEGDVEAPVISACSRCLV